MLDDVEPEYCTWAEKEATNGKLPVRKDWAPELPIPAERLHFAKGEFQENLSASIQQALKDG